MATLERLANLRTLDINNIPAGSVADLHPDFRCPNGIEDPVKVALSISHENLTPTGHRTLALPSTEEIGRVIVKGYFPSPVHVFGKRANEELRHSLKFYSEEGDYAGKATEDDAIYEHEVLSKLRHHNPELISDNNAPIWQIIGLGNVGQEISIWRENDTRSRKHMLVYRRFPYTQWRVADVFVTDNLSLINHELNKLQSLWNVSERKGVYLKSLGRLARANGYLYNANLAHGNLYWGWFDKNNQCRYGRPNTHNIALDGSTGDFEKPDKSYNPGTSNLNILESLGSFSTYLCLIGKMNPAYLLNEEFVSNAISTYRRNLPPRLRQRFARAEESKQLLSDYEMRLRISRSGKKTRNGMEYFDDTFFAEHGGDIITAIHKLITA